MILSLKHPLRQIDKLFNYNAATGVYTSDDDYIAAAYAGSTLIKGDTAGITPQRVEIIVSQAPAPPATPPPTAPVTTPTTPPATTPTEPPTTPTPPTTPPPATTPAPPEDPEKPPVLEEDFKASALMIKAWRPDIKPVERNLLREKKEE